MSMCLTQVDELVVIFFIRVIATSRRSDMYMLSFNI